MIGGVEGLCPRRKILAVYLCRRRVERSEWDRSCVMNAVGEEVDMERG